MATTTKLTSPQLAALESAATGRGIPANDLRGARVRTVASLVKKGLLLEKDGWFVPLTELVDEEPVRETIRVTVVGPNLRPGPRDSHASIHIHAAGCQDLKTRPIYKGHDSWDLDASSIEDVAMEIYPPSDFQYDPETEIGDYTGDIYVAPCVRFPGQTKTAPAGGAAQLTNSRRRALIELADASADGAGMEVNGRQARQPYDYFVEVGYATKSETGKHVYYATLAGVARAKTINRAKYADA